MRIPTRGLPEQREQQKIGVIAAWGLRFHHRILWIPEMQKLLEVGPSLGTTCESLVRDVMETETIRFRSKIGEVLLQYRPTKRGATIFLKVGEDGNTFEASVDKRIERDFDDAPYGLQSFQSKKNGEQEFRYSTQDQNQRQPSFLDEKQRILGHKGLKKLLSVIEQEVERRQAG